MIYSMAGPDEHYVLPKNVRLQSQLQTLDDIDNYKCIKSIIANYSGEKEEVEILDAKTDHCAFELTLYGQSEEKETAIKIETIYFPEQKEKFIRKIYINSNKLVPLKYFYIEINKAALNLKISRIAFEIEGLAND